MKTYGKIHWKVENVTCCIKHGKMTMRTETDEAHEDIHKEERPESRLITFRDVSFI